MDAIVEGPPEDGAPDLSLDTSGWSTHNYQEIVNNNSTLVYIAVGYVKDEYKMEPNVNVARIPDIIGFDEDVSPLDPNMSSVARYSPAYSEPSTDYNPIVIHQLAPPDASQAELISNLESNSGLEAMPVLCNDIREVVENQYLHMVNTADTSPEISNKAPPDQEVELLITDQETGISYSVRSQELLVERCLQDEQLLNSLSPDPLLDSHLLALDDNTLKTELSDEMLNSTVSAAVTNYISNLSANELKSVVESDQFKMETRSNLKSEAEFEEQLLSKVYSIIDKTVQSRARATLPESHLVINKIDDGVGVFARKSIAKSTQFGPLTGLLVGAAPAKSDALEFFVEDDNKVVHVLDVSDENVSNWMSFVRKAGTYAEQNLVVTQEGPDLYFTTTKAILPKQELKAGYSLAYATQHKLSVLAPPLEKSWPCFECSACFTSSDELQNHLNIHDVENEMIKPRKKNPKSAKRKQVKGGGDAVKCNDCSQLFIQPGKLALRQHLIEKHLGGRLDLIDRYFSPVTHFKCDHCCAIFVCEALLKIHNFVHNSDSSDEQTNHVCPSCQRKFPTKRQLVQHVTTHALIKPVKSQRSETFKCPVCHKIFWLREGLRRHMLVHVSDEFKPLQCKTCNKRFLNKSALTGHVKTHFAGKKIFECPICKESFDHVLKLKHHVPKHCENNTYSCPHCSKIFKKYSIVRKHIRAFHCEQKHTCPHCTKTFPTLDKLKMHLLRHSDHREFLCADCGKQFKRKDKLKEHCKRMHSEEGDSDFLRVPRPSSSPQAKKMLPKSEPTDFHRFIYKCHTCLVGFKRRGMLVNHLAKRHPDISMESVPELNLPILQTTRDYYCQHCDKVYKSSSKRKAHILKNHPGAALPMSNRKQGNFTDGVAGLPNPTFSQTVGSITTRPQSCKWCHKQYASKAKLLQHQRKKHGEQMQQGNGGLDKSDDVKMMHLDDVAVDEQCLQDDFKVTEAELNSALEEYSEDQSGEEYCHLVAIAESDGFEPNCDLNAPNSHLYRLLTTSSDLPDLVPPR